MAIPDALIALIGTQAEVIALALLAALAWGAGDFGGGMLSRMAPVFGVVLMSQVIGFLAAGGLSLAAREAFPSVADMGWGALAGAFGVTGVTALYHGLATGRIGVVAPVTGLLAAVIPVLAGFVLEGLPPELVIVGIGAALAAVVLVTRAPHEDPHRPSGLSWGILAGIGFGVFLIAADRLSGDSTFGAFAVIRFVQGALLAGFVLVTRRDWRVPRRLALPMLFVGLADMGGNVLFILAAQAGELAIAAILSSLYPVVTVLLAIVLLRERLSTSHVAGIALTAAAIVLIGAGSATL